MHAGCPLTPSVMIWENFSCSAIFDKRDNRDVFSKPTSRYSTSYCTIYPLFVSIPIYYSTPVGGVLFNYWCIYSFEVKLSGFTEEYWISITDPQDGTGSFSRLLKSFYMYGVMLLLHTRVLMIKTKIIIFMINTHYHRHWRESRKIVQFTW